MSPPDAGDHDPTTVARHYDQLDGFYRDLWGEHVHHGLWIKGDETPREAVEALAGHVADRARIGAGDRVCDAGSGYGATARFLARRRDARVTGITLSSVQHRYAVAASPGSNPRLLLGDWLENELPADSFDAVVAIESTEHMDDPAAAFRQACRVLRPGGRFVVCAWLRADTPPAWAERSLLEPIRKEGRLAWLPSARRLHRKLEASGFEIERSEDLTRDVRRTWSICLRRAAGAVIRRPDTRAFLLDGSRQERVFALTMVRIWLAYRLGVMRYAVITAIRPNPGASPPGHPTAAEET